MKLKTVIMLALLLGLASHIHACPTCASSLDDYTPPFFSEEFYKPYQKNADSSQESDEGEDTNEEGTSTEPGTAE